MLVFVAMIPDSLRERYLAAIILPDEAMSVLAAIVNKNRLPPWEPRVPLHITIAPTYNAHETPDSLASRWQKVASGRAPFQIQLDGFGRFDIDEGSVFLTKVIPSPELSLLADDALAALSDLGTIRSYPFIAHVTMAEGSTRKVVDEYIARTAADAPHLTFTCTQFSVLRLDEGRQRWDVVREFPFLT